MVKAENNQSCNVTDDNQGPDCYESMHAFKKIRTSTSGLRKSPNKWTKEENQKLASLVASYGEKKWKRISAEMGGQKTGAQCAQHWKRVLSPEIRKGHWDENEEDLLLRLVVQYGSCWKKIAKKIPQRTDIQCRYQYLKAKQSREVAWDGKEDESLMKKVMEMANCNFFQVLGNASSSSTTSTPVSRPAPSSSPSSSSGGSGSDSGSLSSSPATTNSPSLSLSMKDISSPMSVTDSPVTSGPRFTDSPRFADSSPLSLRSSGGFSASGSPMLSSPSTSRSVRNSNNKDTDDSNLSSSSGSEEGEEFVKMKMSSGGIHKNAWNDDKHNVNMTESTNDSLGASSWRSFSGNNSNNNKEPSSLSESMMCANCQSPFITHINKVVWLEISEHMARLKLTSTLRTALECKTRFTELLGNKVPLSASTQFNNTAESMKGTGLKNSGDVGRSGFNTNPLGGSGGVGIGNTDGSKSTFDNGIKINNNKMSSPNSATGYNGNNINLTNCNNNNITINITNSYTTNNNTLQNGLNFQQQLTHSTSTASNSSGPIKSEQTLMGPSHLLPKNPVSSILSPAPPFPSFTHLSHSTSFPQLPPVHQLKVPSGNNNARNVHNGLESLAAVASILPREMLADYF